MVTAFPVAGLRFYVRVVPMMIALIRLPCGSGVSLHAPNDALRDNLVPLNRKYPIHEFAGCVQPVSGARSSRLHYFGTACWTESTTSPSTRSNSLTWCSQHVAQVFGANST